MSTATVDQDLQDRTDAELLQIAEDEGFSMRGLRYMRSQHLAHQITHLRQSRAYRPQVGDGMTMAYPQDLYPYVITRVSPSGKTVWVKPLDIVSRATGHEPARYEGPWPVWEHTYTDEERKTMVRNELQEIRVTRSRDGLSWSARATPMLRGDATYRRNYSY